MSFALPVPLLVAAASTADPGGRRDDFYDSRGVGLLPATTLVIWVCCLIVGVIGTFWPDNGLGPATTQPQSTPIQAIEVEVTDQPPPPPPMAPPQMNQIAAPAPPLLAPMLPLDPLTRLMPPAQMPQRPVNSGPAAAPVRTLTFGYGEGRQPKPDYPDEARYAGEQGTVTILFNVGQDGQVVSATAVASCQWPILNQAALRAIRETWRFSPGPPRSYMISIKFELK
jgi:periplasmic protein TonB